MYSSEDFERLFIRYKNEKWHKTKRIGSVKPTVKLEVQLRHRLPPSLERSGKGGGRRWKPGIRVIRQYKIKKGDLCLPRINYFCIVYEV